MAHDVAYEIVNLAKVIEAADKSHALESRRWKMTIGGDYVSSSVQFCHDGAGTTILRMPGRKPLSVATSDLRTVLPQLLVDGFTCYWDGLNPAYQKKSWRVKLYDGKKHASGRWSFPTDQLVTSRVVEGDTLVVILCMHLRAAIKDCLDLAAKVKVAIG